MAVGILTLAMGLVGRGVFQVLSIQRFWRDDVVATRELRHAGSWFAGDALNAEAIDLADGASASAVTLNWRDRNGVARVATYSISGSTLVRGTGDAITSLARRVLIGDFSRSGRVLTFTLEVQADRGGTERMGLETYLRMLK